MGYKYRGKGRKTYMVRYWIDGVRHDESTGTADPKAADAFLRSRETQTDKGVAASVILASRSYTFEDACEAIRMDYRQHNKPSSMRGLTSNLGHLAKKFAGWKLTQISPDAVTKYVDARMFPPDVDGKPVQGASGGTVRGEVANLIRMFSLAVEKGILASVPKFAKPPQGPPRQGFFELDQFHAVMRHLPPYLRGAVTFAYFSGWRMQSEIAPLEWRNVDMDAGTVRLEGWTTKNGEGRLFPFRVLPEIEAVFVEADRRRKALARAGRLCALVFHDDGVPLLVESGGFSRAVEKSWDDACVKAGCPGRLRHDFRRTAVKNLVERGVPEKVAMMITGHKTRDVFDRYHIVNDSQLRNAVATLAGSLAAPKTGKPAIDRRLSIARPPATAAAKARRR